MLLLVRVQCTFWRLWRDAVFLWNPTRLVFWSKKKQILPGRLFLVLMASWEIVPCSWPPTALQQPSERNGYYYWAHMEDLVGPVVGFGWGWRRSREVVRFGELQAFWCVGVIPCFFQFWDLLREWLSTRKPRPRPSLLPCISATERSGVIWEQGWHGVVSSSLQQICGCSSNGFLPAILNNSKSRWMQA